MADENIELVASVVKLAGALGFRSTESKARSKPYLSYIQQQWPGERTELEYLRFVSETIVFFNSNAIYSPPWTIHYLRCASVLILIVGSLSR